VDHRKIPVACVQTQAADRTDFDTFWPHAIGLAEDAARRGARLIVLPEGTVPAYVLGAQPVDLAQLARARDDVARVATAFGATIVYGTARIIEGRTYNSASVIGPDGDELGHAEKQFLWHFDRRWFASGDSLMPIATPVGLLGVLVCADGRIPTIARTLVERGAEILVMPTAWVTSGRDLATLENIQADLMINVRARENGVPFVAANKCGVELESVAYCGKSAIVASDGSFVARAPQNGEAVVFGEIDVGAPSKTHASALNVDDETQRRLRDPVELLRTTQRARIAFAAAAEPDLERFADLARQADADVFISSARRYSRIPTESLPPDCAASIFSQASCGELRPSSVSRWRALAQPNCALTSSFSIAKAVAATQWIPMARSSPEPSTTIAWRRSDTIAPARAQPP